jgi:ribosomal protein S6
VENLTETEMKDAKTYEIGYLLTPFLPADKVEETAEAMYKMLVDDLGGLVVTKTAPKMRSLSYPVSKFINNKKSTVREAYFGAVKFQISPEKIRTIKELLDKDNNVVRFLMVNVPKNSEQIVAPREVTPKRVNLDVAKEVVVEKGEEMTNEEIDKEIEGLLETQSA